MNRALLFFRRRNVLTQSANIVKRYPLSRSYSQHVSSDNAVHEAEISEPEAAVKEAQQKIDEMSAKHFETFSEPIEGESSEQPEVAPSVDINERAVGSSEKHAFRAETKRLLEIVANSLYSEKEVFIRELVSNAADACEKLAYFKLTRASEMLDETELQQTGIHISIDKEKKLFVIQDYGVGMDKSELEENLGTIALSGAGKFLKQLAEDKKGGNTKDAKIIGQFGVGFYSAFTVGDRVDVYSRPAFKGAKGYVWSSDGLGEFTLSEAENVQPGTKIVIHLKGEELRYAETAVVEGIVKKYSNFVGFPVLVNGRQINTVQALWTMSKSQVSQEQYDEFFKFIADSYEGPQMTLHFSADAPVQIRALLFVPKMIPRPDFQPDSTARGNIALYSKKVLIKGKTDDLLPEWLSFVTGVVESEDIPLNLSRELLQNNMLIQKIKRVLTGRVLKWLSETMQRDRTQYAAFYSRAAIYLKRGVISDHEHKKDVTKLMLFDASYTDAQVSVSEYLERLTASSAADSKQIFICLARSRSAALSSPYMESFTKNGIPVLMSYDEWDEYLLPALDVDGYKFVRIEDADLKGMEATVSEMPKEKQDDLVAWMTSLLGNKVKSVKVTTRYTTQPALIVDHAMHATTWKYMKNLMASQAGSGPSMPGMPYMTSPPVDFEVNATHPMIEQLLLLKDTQPEIAKAVAEQLFDNALLQAGLLEDTQPMVARLNTLLTNLVTHKN